MDIQGEKMRIGIDARFFRKETAGLGRYTRSLLKNLSEIDDKNTYTVFITEKDDLEYNIKTRNFKKVIVPITHYTFAEQTQFLKILNKYNFDLVHFLNFNHPVFYNKPFITTIHDLTMLLFPVGRSQKSIIRKIAFKKVMQNAAQKSKITIAVSQKTKEDIIKYFNVKPEKIKVVYEGYDEIYAQKHSKNEIAKVLQKYNIKSPFLLFVSQWRPHKGLPQLIQAFERLKKQYNIPHKLVITGKANNHFPEIIYSIKKSKYFKEIVLPGFVSEPDLPILYQSCESFIFPSFYEGFGLGPLEAMASGAPVISSNLSCMPEILGDAAVYFNPNNIDKMANIIYKTIAKRETLQILRKKSKMQASKYSWEKMAKETLKIYETIG